MFNLNSVREIDSNLNYTIRCKILPSNILSVIRSQKEIERHIFVSVHANFDKWIFASSDSSLTKHLLEFQELHVKINIFE